MVDRRQCSCGMLWVCHIPNRMIVSLLYLIVIVFKRHQEAILGHAPFWDPSGAISVLCSEKPTQLLAYSTWSFPGGNGRAKHAAFQAFHKGSEDVRIDAHAFNESVHVCNLWRNKDMLWKYHEMQWTYWNAWNATIAMCEEVLQQLSGAHPGCLRQKLSTSVFHWTECSNWTATHSNSNAVTSPSCSSFRIHHVCLLDIRTSWIFLIRV